MLPRPPAFIVAMKNCASRIHSVLTAAQGIGRQSGPAYTIWGKVLQFETEVASDRMDFAVAAALHLMRGELDAFEAAMIEKGYPPNLFVQHVRAASHVFRPAMLASDWVNTHAQLSAELVQAFAFGAEMLPVEETAIEPDGLKAVLSLVTELEAMLETSTLPRPLIKLLQHQVELIHEALRIYPLVGAKGLWEASATWLGEVVLSGPTMQPYMNEPEVQKARDVWQTAKAAAEGAIVIGDLVKVGTDVWDALKLLGNG